tara:strand:- start:3013 stop:3354 length:342 start_codon:yes stop_codon:yes gene_type:complete
MDSLLKVIVKSIFILLICVFLFGCSKEPQHSVRVVNGLPMSVSRVRLGEVRFDNMRPNTTTIHSVIVSGNYLLTGMIGGQIYTSDPVSIIGNKGVYKWKLTIESLSRISLIQE